jgi:PKD repeat protein
MKLSSPLSLSPAMGLRLAAVAAIAIILFAANVPITNAHKQQQQQEGLLQLLLQLLTSQPATVGNGTTTFQSTNDSFRVQVPQGWIIQDVNNIGVTLATEVMQGYGVLAQLCPEEEEEQQAVLVNTGGNTSNISSSISSSSNSCGGAQEVIHIIRYPNLGDILGFTSSDGNATADNSNTIPDTVLAYQMQKLQEVGYRDIRIGDSIDTTVNVISTQLNNNVIVTLNAKFVEMTYSTTSAPDETKRGYFLSTATDATPRNLGLITGYGLFYEGNSTTTTAETTTEGNSTTTTAETTTEGNSTTTTAETTTASFSLPPPAPVIQVFDSFELIAGEEAEQATLAALRALITQAAGEEEPADVLTVEIDSNGTEGYAPLPIEFEADITGETEPYTISWDLDDDGITEGNEQTLVVTFNEAGTYDTRLTVTDSEGHIATDSIEITVEEGGEEEAVSTEEEPLVEETTEEETLCDPSYLNTCIPPPPPNLTCDDISARNFLVLPPDPHGFDDNDNDGIGCESASDQPDLDEPDPNLGSDNILGLFGLG